jgi:hypothetical protein
MHRIISRRFSIRAPVIFDREVKRIQKNYSAKDRERSASVDYLRDEVAERLSDRLLVSLIIISYYLPINCTYVMKLMSIGYKATVYKCFGPWIWQWTCRKLSGFKRGRGKADNVGHGRYVFITLNQLCR